ncbi:MAG: cyclic nucleotide-binding domain-containing protein [Nitrospiraceae bacterium]|nr:cyclic nucleotide-binding domain-containing protein [Nitrospiraceae bacterium]
MSDRDKYKRYAEKVIIFKGLTPEEVADILHQGKVLQFRQGDTIFHEGMLGSNLFVVLSGQIEIYIKGTSIARCGIGDAFGEMSVLNNRPRCATAAARTECTLFTLDERQINNILEKHVAVRILLNIVHVLSERLENANARMAGAHSET